MTYVPAKFEVATSNSLGEQEKTLFDLDTGFKVILSVAQYPQHHVTYTLVKFEGAMSKGKGGNAFTGIYII